MGIEVIAHRGAMIEGPENTLAAVNRAIELEADYVEVDLHLSKDGKVIVIHDESINRTTNGSGKIKDLNYSELLKLDAGSWFSDKFSDQKIPLLSDILKLDFKKSALILEVKNTGNMYPDIEKKIVDEIKKSEFKNKIVYKSFTREVLDKFKELDNREILFCTIGPIINGYLYIDDWLRFGAISDYNANYYQIHKRFLSEELIDYLHSKGKKVIAWDVNGEEDISHAIGKKVDIIETDDILSVKNFN